MAGAISLSSSDFEDENFSAPAKRAPSRRAAAATRKRVIEDPTSSMDEGVDDDDDDFAETPPKKVKVTKAPAKRAPAKKTTPAPTAQSTLFDSPPAVAPAKKASGVQSTLFDSPPPKAAPKPRAKPAAKPKAAPKAAPKPLKSMENEMDFDADLESLPASPVRAAPKSTSTPKRPTTAPTLVSPMSSDFAAASPGDASSPVMAPPVAVPGKPKTSTETYQKLTQLQHILKRPDTYIGSVEYLEKFMWTFDKATSAMVWKNVRFVPGLYKIFDEILVNAADNKIRDPNMDTLKVVIDKDANMISIYNNGRGIPIEMHEKEKMFIPELIFGNLLTSSNYDDDEKKVTGGRNGYGAKLCNIFSSEFTLETADKNVKKRYKQVWTNNMGTIGKARITENGKGEEYTRITFKPDLRLFSMTEMDDDLVGIMMRRVYDLAGTCKNVKVFLNGERLKIKNFKTYVEMYVTALSGPPPAPAPVKAEVKDEGDESFEERIEIAPMPVVAAPKPVIVYEQVNERWEIAFAVSDGTFNQVSFVNSIATTSGGTHINYICDQLVKRLGDHVKVKNKNGQVKPNQIRNNIFLFVNCLIENPAFTSQTKETLTTRPSAFGSKCIIADDFFKKVLRTSIVENIMDIATVNADNEMKKQDGSKKSRISGIPKLDDAERAGTRDGHKCTLILTEGDSAKALVIAGLAVVGREHYGVYPLRGKMLNVRDASHDQILKNAEIQAIKRIMGLQHKKNYTSTKDLRYGHLMLFTDQDYDGSHIKGLLINFLEASFPGLLNIPGFLVEFITPIVKVTIHHPRQEPEVIAFYTMPEYESWKETEGSRHRWDHMYYKGLGTSDQSEAVEYFQQLDRHIKEFHTLEEGDKELIDLAFSKKKADERKEWLRLYRPGTFLDMTLPRVPISDFINKELILFSMADNVRSIPSMIDGLKPGQRKVLYGCFKRRLLTHMRVIELVGYVMGNTAYLHGDTSLAQTIVGMAQDFVGSNNINLLQPKGIFGTRSTGGKDAAAARYIFTRLMPITRRLFNVMDEPLLKHNTEDEKKIEPEWYIPILPMVLVNGADGIGTGWSTQIPNYNPRDIINNLRRMMRGEEVVRMDPWYRNWHGTIERIAPDKYRVSGVINQVDNTTLEITELPIRQWTMTAKEFLMSGLEGTEKTRPWIRNMTEEHTMDIKFVVQLTEAEMQAAVAEGLLNKFKLTTTISTNNIVAFDASGRIKKYENAEEILCEFYYLRLEYYQKRKDLIVSTINFQLDRLSNQARFVKMIIEGDLKVSNRKRAELIAELKRLKFLPIGDIRPPGQEDEEDEERRPSKDDDDDDDDFAADPEVKGFDYLLSLKIWSLTRERYEKLMAETRRKEEELTAFLKKTPKDIWNEDLDDFEKAWNEFLEEDRERRSLAPRKRADPKKARKPKPKVKAEVKAEL
ncbi:DNA topoisomerase [Dipodascopsis tothii]|uniref:DNA topoisomerase n=1 Tax=Dipodascopsis tothii TaxID=44089 RepID=UPI0034CDC7D8